MKKKTKKAAKVKACERNYLLMIKTSDGSIETYGFLTSKDRRQAIDDIEQNHTSIQWMITNLDGSLPEG
jgi:hypothetical protein